MTYTQRLVVHSFVKQSFRILENIFADILNRIAEQITHPSYYNHLLLIRRTEVIFTQNRLTRSHVSTLVETNIFLYDIQYTMFRATLYTA